MSNAREVIRRVILRPYMAGKGPSFTLTLYPAAWSGGRDRLAYKLTQRENGRTMVIFEGDDFGPSPLDAHDSDATVGALLGFLTLRPGDTDPDYFADYTEAQRAFCAEHAEALSADAHFRFSEAD